MRQILTFIVSLFFIQAYGQLENRSQPDSIYRNRKVKYIYAYLNSSKDLSEIIEFDKDGHKIRSVKYSASYNKKTRKRKHIDMISIFKYDSQMKLIQIIDSANSTDVNNYFFYYDSTGALTTKKYFQGKFNTPIKETYYQTNPLQETTIRRYDSLIIYHETKEYEKEFYVNKSYGYSFNPKIKSMFIVSNSDTSRYKYFDYSDMVRHDDTMTVKNTFNSKGQLTNSAIKSIFMDNRIREYLLTYKYYPDGLLKSIRGYVPEFFKYEFY